MGVVVMPRVEAAIPSAACGVAHAGAGATIAAPLEINAQTPRVGDVLTSRDKGDPR